jgi:3-deoxy-D-manno-octulosonic-acid transferase
MRLFLYNFLLFLVIPIMGIRILLKSLRDKDYRSHFLHRLGIYKNSHDHKKVVWFHAVSLGEVISSKSIIEEILKKYTLILSVSTPTGLREAKKLFGNKVEVVYAPWDFILCVKGFFRSFDPIALVLFETEIWPSFIEVASSKKIPIILSNGRMSESSFNRYKIFKSFVKNIIQKITIVLAQSDEHKMRFNKLGASLEKVKQVGSAKFDLNINFENKSLKPKNKNLIFAASTHKGEDELIIDAFRKLKLDLPDIRLVIAPRHPERATSILKIADSKGLPTSIHSSMPDDLEKDEIIIISATGLMKEIYSLSSVTLVGGSLLKNYGGHNIIEAAAEKCAFIVGPYMKNFEDVLAEFLKNGSCIQLNNDLEIFKAFKDLLTNDELRDDMVIRALDVCINNTGSAKKQYNAILETIRENTK